MKTSIFFSVLFATIIGLSSCGSDSEPDQSTACDVISFKDGTKDWNINGSTITGSYAKGAAVNNVSPTIVVSDKAKVSPESGVVQDFSSGKTVTYTVTAEDGNTKKTYTAAATVATN